MTEREPGRQRRRPVRLAGYDYASPGAYFVTVCTYGRRCTFDVSVFRDVIEVTWRRITHHFPDARTDEFVVMPNHVHGILWILKANVVGAQNAGQAESQSRVGARHAGQAESQSRVGARHAGQAESQSRVGARHASPLRGYAVRTSGAAAGSLGAIIGSFKSAATKRVNEILGTPGAPFWQSNYYERVIRNENELHRVREYIRLNPLQWDFDRENPYRVLNAAHEREWGWLEGNSSDSGSGRLARSASSNKPS